MDSFSSLSQKQQQVVALIYDNELAQLLEVVPMLPTLNFIDAQSLRTPLGLAVATAEEEVIEYLLLCEADPNFASPQTLPLLLAIERSIAADNYGVDTGDPTREEDPLFIVELLVRYGADFNKKDPAGRTAYDYALKVRHPAWRLFERLTHEAAARRQGQQGTSPKEAPA